MANGNATQHLPLEIVSLIIEQIPSRKESQGTLYNAALVSRTWYSATLPRLYASPHIDGNNFQRFVRTVCPSVNAHVRKSDLSDLVVVLDMKNLIHDSSRSMTARILSRLKPQLQVFVAPCTTFSLNSFSALSKCFNLQTLDLSYVTEYVSLDRLFNSIGKLSKLHTLHISRSIVSDAIAARLRLGRELDIRAPQKLKSLQISGKTATAAGDLLCAMDLKLESLSISHCRVDNVLEAQLLRRLSPRILSIAIGPRFDTPNGVNYEDLIISHPSLHQLTLNEPGQIAAFQITLRDLMERNVATSLRTLTFNWFEEESGRPEMNAPYGGIDLDLLFDVISSDCAPLKDLETMIIRYPRRFARSSMFQKGLADLAELLEALRKERKPRVVDAIQQIEGGVWLTELNDVVH